MAANTKSNIGITIGIATFSTEAYTVLSLVNDTNKLNESIDDYVRIGGATNLYAGLLEARKIILNGSVERFEVPKKIIVFTDGVPNLPVINVTDGDELALNRAEFAAKQIKDDGVELITVITPDNMPPGDVVRLTNFLRDEIASRPDLAFSSGFELTDEFIKNLVKSLC
jgi:Mg-chelatase subunit ChlD